MEAKDSTIEGKIINYLSGCASRDDIETIKEWLQQSNENKRLFDEISDVWSATYPKNKKVFNSRDAYEHLQKRLWKQKEAVTVAPGRQLRFYRTAFGIAATLLVILGIGMLLTGLNSTHRLKAHESFITEIVAPEGSKSKVVLPDGTKVWLNGGSKISYNVSFGVNNRRIRLEGEAFFDVIKNREFPFLVSTIENVTIKVLGTAFNLKAYPNEGSIEATLVRGSLIVEHKTKNEVSQTILAPNQRATFVKEYGKLFLSDTETRILKQEKIRSDQVKGKVLFARKIDPEVYTAWKDNKLVFRNESFEALTVKLERWYGVKIIIADERIKDYHFNGTIENETIHDVMEVIRFTLPIHYTIQHNTITIKK